MRAFQLVLAAAVVTAACGGGGGNSTPDAGVTTDKCTYEPLTPTAGAGGTVDPGPLQAGAAERILDVPVGTALGGYTARAGFLGSAGVVDTRKVAISGTFNPSIGVATAPRVKAVALTAGNESVVIIKVDMIFVYEGMLYDVEQALGPVYAGKVILAASHSHSAWAQYTAHGPLKLGAGQQRDVVYQRFVDTIVATAQDAISAQRAAKIGFFFDGNFDPPNDINHDRRSENDALPGGNVKDNHFFMIRIDGTDDVPIAAIPVFGEHGTLNDETNSLASTDAPGALERVLQEQFPTPVVVMHMQSAGGDNSPSGHGGIDCTVHPGKASDPCLSWATEEGHGRVAEPVLMNAYEMAGQSMVDTLPMEMLTRSVETGPKPTTFSIRGGALTYAAWDGSTLPDGKIYEADGSTLISPIDEFNAPVGAGLCEYPTAMFPAAQIPGTDGLLPYGSCLKLDIAGSILGPIFDVDFGVDQTSPVCETTRTTISALRIGDYLIGTMPGELTVMLATYLRTQSPVDAAHTILLGYAQGHVGYMLRPEDWMTGGYEPSVTFWGPLEAEYLGERLLDLLPLALTDMREDGTTGGTTKVATVKVTDTLDMDDPAPNAGTVPATVPPEMWARTGTLAQAQPAAQISRVSGIATFVWDGDDPLVKTPRVTLQVQTGPSTFADVTRKSGRVVQDQDLILAYTPVPLQRSGPQTHVWNVEWQAVPWLGAPNDSLDQRGGVALGTYRFHVEGNGWTLDSNSFDVVPGGVNVAAQRTSGTIQVITSWYAPSGYRLMDTGVDSNRPVPLRSQAVTVDLLDAGNAVLATSTPTTDATGVVNVTDNASAVTARVTDQFGNIGTIAIQ